MASGTHEVKYVAADGTESTTKFFTGNSAISFSDLQKNFGGSGTPSNVSVSTFLRDTNVNTNNPIVPDSPSNASVKTSTADMNLAGYRETLKKIKVRLTDATIEEYNSDNLWTASPGSVNDNTDLSGDLNKNTPKQQVITAQTTVKAPNANTPAMTWDSGTDVHNLELTVQGEIHGFSGDGGEFNAGWDEGKQGRPGGTALHINPTSGSSKILVNVEGGGGAIWGGGGGGAGGYDGEAGIDGVTGSPGEKGHDRETTCTVDYTEKTEWNWSRENYVRYWWRERCNRRRGWGWRRRHRKHRSRCEKSEWQRTRCTGYYSGAGKSKSGVSGQKGRCNKSCESQLRSGDVVAELVGSECVTANRKKCESKLTCKYESKTKVTSEGGSAGQHGNAGTGGLLGEGSSGGHGAGTHTAGTYNAGQPTPKAYVPHKAGNSASNPNCEGGEGETKRCWDGNLKSASRRGAKGEDGKDCTPSTDGTDGTAGQGGATGGDWGQAGSSIIKGSRTVLGGAGGAAISGRSSHYEVATAGGGSVSGST